ncbi:MAG: Ig-like domain repeat protein [Chloroflexi bacterium]|nr:Ig-like domain repeat protein [Chloroflexota bacterium]
MRAITQNAGTPIAGDMWAWGDSIANVPTRITSLSNVISLKSGGVLRLALNSDGTVWSWDGTNPPVQISGLNSIIAIDAAYAHNLALKSDGTVWAWGNNGGGELGNGTTSNSNVPVQVSNLTGIVEISAGGGSFAAGYAHSLAIKSDGTVWAWGANTYGQLGNGTTVNSSTPVQVSGLSNMIDVSANLQYSLALKNDGTVWAWGVNGNGQLGNGTTLRSLVPTPVVGLRNIVAIEAGGASSTALMSDGTARAWGNNLVSGNSAGSLGNGGVLASGIYASSVPVRVNELINITSISNGQDYSLALGSNGTVWSWGNNYYGQLGNGTTQPSDVPVQVNGLNDVLLISGGYNRSGALSSEPLTPSTTALVSSANPSVVGQPVTFTATVSAVPPASGTPTGMVTFKDGTITLASVALDAGGQASYTTSNLSLGEHSITATYATDNVYGSSSSPVVIQIVNPVPGDANGDNSVNALDITKVERVIAGLDTTTAGADANGDGNVNALDITKVERIIAGLD